MPTSPEQAIEAHFLPDPPAKLGVAVSGGGDSVALLVLLHEIAKTADVTLACVTVDHGLRPEAAQEAQAVAALCRDLEIAHSILEWSGWDGSGNMQNAARLARYQLIAEWARDRGISDVALGHTVEDQAETVLMRLSRAAGVDGLSAMSARRVQYGVSWQRPLLAVSRTALRVFLTDRSVPWVDDPSNDEGRYERIRFRNAAGRLSDLGLTTSALVQVAENMASVRDALAHYTQEAARACATLRAGAVEISKPDFDALPQEISRRLLIAALAWITGAPYAPRQSALASTLAALDVQKSATLDGCHLKIIGSHLWIFREYKAVEALTAPLCTLWDDRWQLEGPAPAAGYHIAALGDPGLQERPDWRGSGLPREHLRSSPAVWDGRVLVAAPLLDTRCAWSARLKKREMSFFDTAFPH